MCSLPLELLPHLTPSPLPETHIARTPYPFGRRSIFFKPFAALDLLVLLLFTLTACYPFAAFPSTAALIPFAFLFLAAGCVLTRLTNGLKLVKHMKEVGESLLASNASALYEALKLHTAVHLLTIFEAPLANDVPLF